MTLSFAVLLGLMVASASALEGPMSSLMRVASKKVEDACSADVLRLCSTQPTLHDLLPHPMLRMGTPSRDPFMEFVMNPMAPPPPLMVNDIGLMIDQMMSQAIQLSKEEPAGFVRIFVVNDDEGSEKPQEQPVTTEQPAAPEALFDSIVHSVMDRAAVSPIPSEDGDLPPGLLLQRLVEHGNNMLESDLADEDHLRLARRLTQANPDDFQHTGPRLLLPFGCEKNRCLLSAYEEGATSTSCADALKAAETTREAIVLRSTLMVHEENEAFYTFTILYAFLALVTLLALRKHLKTIGHRMRTHLRLKYRILQAVYNDPEIKAKVEDSIGDDLGHVPPLPPHVLARMGGPTNFSPGFFLYKMWKLVMLALILSLIFVNPVIAMPLLCIIMLQRFIQLACCPPHPPVAMCSCCCCSLSTEDVANGNVSSEQACCTCCNGMGVCSPGCVSCCGTDPDAACDCCEDDCDCCSGGKDVCKEEAVSCSGVKEDAGKEKAVCKPKETIYEGVPIQVV